jgi:putative membrane-bound dehydrogenase-like protein
MGAWGDAPQTGPETEKRFPPLKLADGFKATLFACDPFIEYPSAIALGPRADSLFVAVDYMTGLGTEIVRRDEIRLIEDTDHDGYADKSTVYAGGFNSIEGMTFHDGTVFVMHAPFLTALRDTNGDGVADERRDLVRGLGLAPEDNPPRLHCANGLVWGYDGWLYLALGDHGCQVTRPEGDKLVFNGGGILRCRTDGRDLHVFATGLRNIYDVALDEDLNVFVRDNENDGGDYKIRVCHSFFDADHGYPYLYYERPDEAMPPLADLGLGSSAGGLAYLEPTFPPEFRGNLFFCEWGRSVVRYVPKRHRSGFAPVEEFEFAAGAENDPYGFKPTDLVVGRDGALFVSDWADGQRPKRGRGRIYRIMPSGQPTPQRREGGPGTRSVADLFRRLDSDSYYERIEAQSAISANGAATLNDLSRDVLGRLGVRGRMHAVWLLGLLGGEDATPAILELARSDPDPRVQVQAVRVLADMHDPVLRERRLTGVTSDPQFAEQLAQLAKGRDPRVVREIGVALGRLSWPGLPRWVERHLSDNDPAMAHGFMQALRRSRNWPAILRIIDDSPRETVRSVALRAIADQPVPELVDGLVDRLRREPTAARRSAYADLLSRVYKQPGPWVYWGYRPVPRPPHTVAWERTDAIIAALDQSLADPDRTVRLAVLRRMQREQIGPQLTPLVRWLDTEHEPERAAAILASLNERGTAEIRDPLCQVIRDARHSPANRLAALTRLARDKDEATVHDWSELCEGIEDGPVFVEAIRHAARSIQSADPARSVAVAEATPRLVTLLIRKLRSPLPDVRASAVDALAELRVAAAADQVGQLLGDSHAVVRRAAAAAAALLPVPNARESLGELAGDADSLVRRAAFDSLRTLGDPRAVAQAAASLATHDTELAALRYVAAYGGPEHAPAIFDLAQRSPTAEILPAVVQCLSRWSDSSDAPPSVRADLLRTVAELHGATGTLVRWETAGPLTANRAAEFVDRSQAAGREPPEWLLDSTVTRAFAAGPDARATLGKADPNSNSHWLAHTEVVLAQAGSVQFLASSNGSLRVWVNGQSVFERKQSGPLRTDADRFDAELLRGLNRVVVEVEAPAAAQSSAVEVQLRFRRKSSTAEHEQLVQAALTRPGNIERGRGLFANTEKTQCAKCHRIGPQGERIGPELTGVGGRFSRIYLVESILEPSRSIAPSFETVMVALKDGRVFTGLPTDETVHSLTLADNQGQRHILAKPDIEERRPQPQSTMPDDLFKRMTTDEFVDLVAFLVSQK